ncbi:ribosomal protein S6 kinase-like 1 isoform X4 [Homo sapiens]|uniref:ribosomal protein S6 kinase-like 1 isoform X4 n=1 Tax=Homo sapiens TaxID=9606 RepID=UPI0023DEED4F|nr:ribosomal protein S6 kinase-like 1 isoform X4 [Homo sapiens]
MSLVACECLPSPGLEPEPCSQARSQAHVYLEQIRNRVALGVPDMTKRDYLVDAATQIRLALERDVSEDYEAAFNHYQNGVDVLLRGIHVDPNKERREAVKLKITKYLRRAEEIFNCHLQRLLSSGASPSAGFSSLRLRPIRTLSSAVEQLRGCRVVGVIEKRDLAVLPRLVSNSLPQVQLVQDPATGGTFVVKSLPRCHMVSRERLTIIPHGVPYMTKLLRYFVSEDSIFLHLEHVQGGTLWSHLLSQAHSRHSGLSSGSTQERMKAQLNPHLNLLTPARLPSGHAPGQDRIALEPPRTSPNLLLAGEAPSTRPQREAEGEPTARTSTSGSSDLPKAPGGHLHLQARRAGQNSDAGPPRGLTWVPEGAGPVLGGCGRGMDQSCLSADGAGRGCGRATWSVREEQVKQWAAEMLVALEALHEQGVLCRDLHPGNLLLDQAGHIRLTYFGQWSEVEPQCCGEAVDNLYSAPEVGGISELTEACDWWSFGSLLYELLTGMLLQFEPTRRLGMGEGGVSKLKSHPFFSTIQWSKLVGALVLLSGTHFPPVTDLHRGMASLQELSRQGLWKRQGCV